MDSLSTTYSEREDQVAKEADAVIKSATKCIDRGEDPQSGKRGKCHVFLDYSNICQCEDVDVNKQKIK